MRCAGFSLARSSTEGDEAGPRAGITAALTRSLVEPQCPKKPRAFWAVTAPSALPSASRVLASALRKSPLIFENVSSMGLRSGEYAGKNKSSQPSSTNSRTPSPLRTERLSITTTCPGESDGARIRLTYDSKTAFVALLTTATHEPIPSALMLASNVVFLLRLRGALPYSSLAPTSPRE